MAGLPAELVGGCDGRAADEIELREQGLRFLSEVGHVPLGKRRCLRKLDLERVTMGASDAEFVVEVRPGGEAGAADVSDDLALFDTFPRPDPFREPREVGIQCGVGRSVLQDDGPSISPLTSGEDDPPIAGGFHGGTPRSRVIDPTVRPYLVEKRMASAEAEA